MQSKRTYFVVVLICLGIAFFLFAYPNYVIRPDRAQGVGELRAAIWILRHRGPVEILAAVLAVIAAFAYGRRKVGVIAATAGTVLFAALAQVNIYELMFHPVRPAFEAAAQSNLDGDEKVIAISMHGAPRAYPVRSISYHHIVNDVLDGVPIVATY
jgi:hypothetical protein